MRIKKISLENFRQFVGKNEIVFSTDGAKNVTLVMGNNGFGKTTLNQAFLWCFYGKTSFEKKEDLLSASAKQGYVNMSVTVEFTHAGEDYALLRSKSYINGNENTVSCRLDYISDGESKTLLREKVSQKINEILPEDLSKYFFLKGEEIESMAKGVQGGKSKSFSNAVNVLLGLDYYKNAIKDLDEIAKEFNLQVIPGVANVNAIEDQVKTTEEKINQVKNKISSHKEYVRKYEDELLDKKAEMKTKNSASEIQKKKENAEKQKEKYEQKIRDEVKAAVKEFSRDAPYFFAQSVFLKELKTLQEILALPADDVPEKLHADLIDWIEKRGECICGACVKEGDNAYNLLEKLRKIVPPESIGTLVSHEKSKIYDKYRLGSGLYESFQMHKKRLDEENEDLESKQNEIEELTEKLRTLEDTSQLQKEIDQLEKWRNSARSDLDLLEPEINRLNTKLNSYQTELDEARKKLKDGLFIQECYETASRLKDDFSAEFQKEEYAKRDELICSVKEAFRKIYGDSYSIQINDDYAIRTDLDLETSTGQGMCVIFAFLAGLLSVIQRNQNTNGAANSLELESYPLVFDAPFSVLDEKRIASICEFLPRVSSQIIIFVKDTDGKVAKEHLTSRLGKFYSLHKKDNDEKRTEIKEETL